MKLRDAPKTYGGAVTHVWPPQLLVQIGRMIAQPGEGVLKSVKRFGNRLSLTVEHEGQEAWGGVEVSTGSGLPEHRAAWRRIDTCPQALNRSGRIGRASSPDT